MNLIFILTNILIFTCILTIVTLQPKIISQTKVINLRYNVQPLVIVKHGPIHYTDFYQYNSIEERWLESKFKCNMLPVYILPKAEIFWHGYMAPKYLIAKDNKIIFESFGGDIFFIETNETIGAFLTQELFEEHSIKPGDKLVLLTVEGKKLCTIKVLGIIKESFLEAFKEAYGSNPKIIFFGVKIGVQVGYLALNFAKSLEESEVFKEGYDIYLCLNKSLIAKTWVKLVSFSGLEALSLLIFISLMVSIIVLNVIHARRREFKIISILGMTPRDLILLALIELLVLYTYSITGALLLLNTFMILFPLNVNIHLIQIIIFTPIPFLITPVIISLREAIREIIAFKRVAVSFKEVKLNDWNEVPIYFPSHLRDKLVKYILNKLSTYDPYTQARVSILKVSSVNNAIEVKLHFIHINIETPIIIYLKFLTKRNRCIILFKPVTLTGKWGTAEKTTLTIFVRMFRRYLLKLQYKMLR